jgi:Family of unknown function (DUF6847)
MKLAEGLALRPDAMRRVDRLRARIAASARYQEGEEPPEDASALLAEAGTALAELLRRRSVGRSMLVRANKQNCLTEPGCFRGGRCKSPAMSSRRNCGQSLP